jgi:hypothetical protein
VGESETFLRHSVKWMFVNSSSCNDWMNGENGLRKLAVEPASVPDD